MFRKYLEWLVVKYRCVSNLMLIFFYIFIGVNVKYILRECVGLECFLLKGLEG